MNKPEAGAHKKNMGKRTGGHFEAFIKMSQKQNAAEIKRTLCVIHSEPCERHQQQKTDCGSGSRDPGPK